MITIYKTNSMKSASDYVMYRLQHVAKTDLSVVHTVIVPDRASLEAERALLKAVGGSFNVQVRTLRRLANEVLPKYSYLSKQAGIMALTGIIQDNKANLTCYTKGVDTAGFVADMYDTISMMKYCRISPDNLTSRDLPKGLSGKAHDIALLYRAYLDFTQNRFIDSADKLDLLCEELPHSQTVTNGYFYLYDFDNFSRQELALVEQLMKYSRGVTVACCASDNYADCRLYLNDIFNGVLNLCKNLPHEVVEETHHQNKYTRHIGEHLFRYDEVAPIEAESFVEVFQGTTRTQEVYQLACRIQQYVRSGGRYRDVYVVTSDLNKYYNAVQTVFDEMEISAFCDKQFELVKHPYARFVLDYLALCKNNARLNSVLPFVKNYLFCGSFNGIDGAEIFGLSKLAEETESLGVSESDAVDTAVASELDAVEEAVAQKPDATDAAVAGATAQPLDETPSATEGEFILGDDLDDLGFEDAPARETENDVFHFENYCLKYNVSYDFSQFRLGADDPYFEAADAFRQKLFDLQSAAPVPAVGSVSQFVQAVRNLVKVFFLNERNAAYARLQNNHGLTFESKVTTQAQQKFEEVLFQAEQIFGQRQMRLDEFVKMLNVAVSAVKISVIPVSNDCVVFANMAKARKHDIKFLALLGANAGVMPIVKSDCKLLSDDNILALTEAGIPVEPQIFTENKRESFSLFQLLQEPTSKLYVSCAAMDGAHALLPSPFVAELQKLFCVDGEKLAFSPVCEDVFTEKQAIAKVVQNQRRLADNQVVTMPTFSVLKQRFNNDASRYQFDNDGQVNIGCGKQLFLERETMDVSRLTKFYDCPYSFYFRYGLGIQPRKLAELNAADLGSILHEVLDRFVRDLDVDETDDVTRKRATDCFEAAIATDFFRALRDDPQYIGTLAQLKDKSLKMCSVVKKQLRQSDFRNKGTEMKFGPGSKLPPVEVDFGTGKFLLKGTIDRVDTFHNKFFVLDYKSGAKAAEYGEKSLYIGSKMQLAVYVKAVQNAFEGYTPAGFYYFNVHNKFADISDDKVYVYCGRTLNDVDLAVAIDNNLQNGFSEKLKMKLANPTVDKKNKQVIQKIDGSCRSLLTSEQFDSQVDYAMLMIEQAGKLMSNGYAAMNPYDKKCEFCDYRSICDFGDVVNGVGRKVSGTVNASTIDNVVKACKNSQHNNKT